MNAGWQRVKNGIGAAVITLDQLKTIMPRAGQRATVFLEPINRAMDLFEINSPLRQAAFLAQIAHESGSLRYTAEIASGATCTPGAQVYVETAAGSTQGRITPTPSTTAAPMRSRNRVAVVFSQTDPSGGASAAITI